MIRGLTTGRPRGLFVGVGFLILTLWAGFACELSGGLPRLFTLASGTCSSEASELWFSWHSKENGEERPLAVFSGSASSRTAKTLPFLGKVSATIFSAILLLLIFCFFFAGASASAAANSNSARTSSIGMWARVLQFAVSIVCLLTWRPDFGLSLKGFSGSASPDGLERGINPLFASRTSFGMRLGPRGDGCLNGASRLALHIGVNISLCPNVIDKMQDETQIR